MAEIVKCIHCYYLDYLDKDPKQCPKCGSPTEKIENPFKDDLITVKITNTRRKKYKIEVSFNELSGVINNMIGYDMGKTIPDAGSKSRVMFMIKAYTWSLLKIQPQLWTDIDAVVVGIKELVTLRIDKGV